MSVWRNWRALRAYFTAVLKTRLNGPMVPYKGGSLRNYLRDVRDFEKEQVVFPKADEHYRKERLRQYKTDQNRGERE